MPSIEWTDHVIQRHSWNRASDLWWMASSLFWSLVAEHSGWFGLGGGSAMSPNVITIQACINSNLAAAAGALTGVLLVWPFLVIFRTLVSRRYLSYQFVSLVPMYLVSIQSSIQTRFPPYFYTLLTSRRSTIKIRLRISTRSLFPMPHDCLLDELLLGTTCRLSTPVELI